MKYLKLFENFNQSVLRPGMNIEECYWDGDDIKIETNEGDFMISCIGEELPEVKVTGNINRDVEAPVNPVQWDEEDDDPETFRVSPHVFYEDDPESYISEPDYLDQFKGVIKDVKFVDDAQVIVTNDGKIMKIIFGELSAL
jgi:hypothetical protein